MYRRTFRCLNLLPRGLFFVRHSHSLFRQKTLHSTIIRRNFSANGANANKDTLRNRNKTLGLYTLSIVIGFIGVSYAAVPLYKIFCQVTGFGGTTRKLTAQEYEDMKKKKLTPVTSAPPITVHFEATKSDNLPWTFKPQQTEIKVVPGETALAFYTARNETKDPIVGVASYNITPLKAGLYFNKIQCFCFDQQRLRPNEETLTLPMIQK
eukprot:maker-scaffold_55-snap-gene-1.0-mRNA-1 protein AED:0.01 eAED:0.01 QI:82/1/1/1/0/0/2/422/208